MKEDWVAAEVDRRIRLMEAETGGKVPRGKRREIKRRMRREISRGTGRMEDEAARDQRDAARHGLARELKRAGILEAGVYLRMGELPEGRERGVSSKAVFGYEEGGLSVFAAAKLGEARTGEPLLSAVEGVEPLGRGKVLACEPSSRALEELNDRRSRVRGGA